MGKKKKDTIELRFYEIPQNEYVLALLGENWIRDYGHDEVHLHFHNLMEIGVCRNGTGKLILDEEQRPYQPAMVSIIPNNYPHVTISNTKEGPSYYCGNVSEERAVLPGTDPESQPESAVSP